MKTLRKKIFWSIELSAVSILFLILFIFNLVQYFQYEQKEWKMLSSVMDSAVETFEFNYESGQPNNFSENKSFHGFEKTGKHKRNKDTTEIINNLVSGEIALIQLNSDGDVSNYFGFIEESSEKELLELVKTILEKNTSEGHFHGMKFIYKRFDSFRLISVLDSGYINMDVILLALISLFGLLAAATLFAFIARKISIMIAKPIEETFLIQKQFIADASHELKTPISVMLANIAVLEKEFGTNRFMDYLKEEGKRMADLINSLLMLSKLDYEEDETAIKKNFVIFNLSDALFETALPFESVAFEMGLNYLIQIPNNISAYGIPEDIKQVTGILLDNALKYTDKHGSVILNVTEKIQKKNLHNIKQIVIRIKNTGIPISPDDLPQIFNRFYKADSSRKYKENSFGLGLSIAKSLVEKNKGNITVESNSEFTVFSIFLSQPGTDKALL